jgi:hypothetical protein
MLGAILPQAGKRYDSAMKSWAVVIALGLAMAHAADAPPSAADLIVKARAEAATGRRAVWVLFHASW